jgi:hypothetical protein
MAATEYSRVLRRLHASPFLSSVVTSASSVSVVSEGDSASDTSIQESDDTDFHIAIHQGRGRIRNQILRAVYQNWREDIAFTFRDMFRSSNRSIMAVIWCGYTLTVMLIANGFFPYVVLYSLLFFLILYADTIQERRR